MILVFDYLFPELITLVGIIKATMSKSSKSSEQLVEIDNLIANYQKHLRMLRVEILKLELKKEKLMEKIILQSLKSEIAKKTKKLGGIPDSNVSKHQTSA